MIEQLHVQNYKALRDVTLDLTPIHVLIGPNDSGKTSILEALYTVFRSADLPLEAAFRGRWKARELVWNDGAEEVSVVKFGVRIGDANAPLDYALACAFRSSERYIFIDAEEITPSGSGQTTRLPSAQQPKTFLWTTRHSGASPEETIRALVDQVIAELAPGAQYYRWNPRLLALPVAPDATRKFRMEESGFGLALCLDDILGYDRDRFVALETRFRELFPQVKSIKLIAEPAYRAAIDESRTVPMLQSSDGKGIYFELAGSRNLVPASQASDGTLLVLAYLTLFYLPDPPRMLLVEEPENGIHPKRLKDVLQILKDLVQSQSHTQVVLATHSPYVLDLFEPQEVTLCQKGSDGAVIVRRLSESEVVRRCLDVFTLGEIWTAEGDEAIGRAEQPVREPAQ